MCVRSLGDEEQIALDDSACASLKQPVSEKTCHQTDVLCPKISRWISSPWDDVSNKMIFLGFNLWDEETIYLQIVISIFVVVITKKIRQ